MKSLRIAKMVSVFSKRSMLACMIAGGALLLNSCDKDSMDGFDISSVEPSRPPILTKVPAPILKDMEVFTGMNNNSQKRIEAYLKNMTSAKVKTINLFKNANVFGNLSQNKQLEVISEVLGFDSVNEYVKYAKFMEEKRQHIVHYVKENSISSSQLINELSAVENSLLVYTKSARSSYEEIPDDWVDVEAYIGSSPECKEYSACVTNKAAEGIITTVVATGVGAATAGPVGATIGFLGGLVTTGFVTIYAATFGDCKLKREQCKVNHRPYGEVSPWDSENPNPNLGTGLTSPWGVRIPYTPPIIR